MNSGEELRFDWDDGNREKCQKHGVSLETIEALFTQTLYVEPDPATAEERFRAVGRARDGRSVFLVFTTRERNEQLLIRPISARYMHQREVDAYEKTISDL